MSKKANQTSDDAMPERIIFPASKDLAEAIANYRFDKRCESKAEAIRRLIVAGLKAEGAKLPRE